MLAILIEIFYLRELQKKLKKVDELVDMLVACDLSFLLRICIILPTQFARSTM